MNREFDKVEGVGIILPSPTASLADFYKYNKIQKPIANLKFHAPLTEEGERIKDPEIHLIASYVEPFELNKAAVGIDISLERKRYLAALRARDSGLPSITDNVLLFQNKIIGSAGFILFIPFYKKNYQLSTANQRKKAFAGLVYSPVIADKFFASILEKFDQDLSADVYTSSAIDPSKKVYSSKNQALDPENKIIKSTRLLGKTMTFVWRKASGFEPTSGLVFSLISFFGATVTLLMAMMLYSLQTITHRAQALADQKTKEVLEKNIIWKNLTETSPVGIYLTDKDGSCTYVNKTWSELTGLSFEQAQGDGWIHSLYEDDVDLVMTNWETMKRIGKFTCNYRFLNSKKEIVHISDRKSVV